MKILINVFLLMFISWAFTSCYKEVVVTKDDENNNGGEGLADWTTATHSGDAIPNYSEVFANDDVKRFDIVINSDDWTIMQNDLQEIMKNNGGSGKFSSETPTYVPCQLYYNNKQWYNVGIRYKGNSSLFSTYQNGIKKFPLRLEFDQYEDKFPAIKNQTFYGFSELSLANNFEDKSLMREKIASDLFREFGVPAAQTAYYQIYIDYGNGPVYYGLYTLVEIVFDTMLDNQFGSDNGNCYKPENEGAAFAASNFNLVDFEKKTNKDLGDWSDIQTLYNALHANNRTTEPDKWKTNLEKVFDVDGFLKWLAVNTTIQNWDTYGKMTHNYYLYNDPANGLIKWIPWDNNEAFQNGKMGGALDYNFTGMAKESWPLISYIIGNDSYKLKYNNYIKSFITNVFEPTKMEARYNKNRTLIEDAANAEQVGYSFLSSGSFDASVNTLINHCITRHSEADAYLQ